MITREDVADLQPGDVIEVTNDKYPDVTMRGPLRPDPESRRRLLLGATVIRCDDGSPLYRDWDLTLVSRAPRPLYTNSDRTEPLMNDVARKPGEGDAHRVWIFDGFDWWFPNGDTVVMVTTDDMPRPMRLLVEGETGQVVQ